MTISFHHAFCSGDLTLNQVMETLVAIGFRNLTLASSSLSDCHALRWLGISATMW